MFDLFGLGAKLITVVTAIIMSTWVFGCAPRIEAPDDEADQGEQQIAELKQRLEAKERTIEATEEEKAFLQSEINRYHALMGAALDKLPDQDRNQVAKKAWDYSLEANDQKVPPEGKIEIDRTDVKIQLIEKMPPGFLYADYTELLNQQRLDDYDIQLLTEEKLHKKTAASGTVVDVPVVYMFKGLQDGDVIKLEVSAELKQRLGLQTRDIRLTVIQ